MYQVSRGVTLIVGELSRENAYGTPLKRVSDVYEFSLPGRGNLG